MNVDGLTRDVPVARQHNHHLDVFSRAEPPYGNPAGRACELPATLSVSIRASDEIQQIIKMLNPEKR
jgi:hypothetical protein